VEILCTVIVSVLYFCSWKFVLSCDAFGRLKSELNFEAILIIAFIVATVLPSISTATFDI
jgi:hypothetical protein